MLSPDSSNDEPKKENEPGFGGSTENPVGIPFNFLSGVVLESGKVHTPDFCLTPDSLISLFSSETREKLKERQVILRFA